MGGHWPPDQPERPEDSAPVRAPMARRGDQSAMPPAVADCPNSPREGLTLPPIVLGRETGNALRSRRLHHRPVLLAGERCAVQLSEFELEDYQKGRRDAAAMHKR